MKKFPVLIAGAVALSLAAWFASHREQQRFGVSEGDLLVPGLSEQLGAIENVTLKPAGNETTTLATKDGQWVVRERADYPANTEALRKELRKLAQARRVEAKTAQAELYPQLGVEEVDQAQDTTLQLTAQAGGETVLDIIIGKSTAGGSYVRLRDDPQSWLIDQRITLPRVTVAWLDTQLVSIARTDVQQLALKPLSGPEYAILKDDPEQADFSVEPPVPGGESLNAANVNRLGAALSSLRVQDVATAVPDDLKWAQATLTTFDGLILHVEVAKTEDNTRYLRLSASARDQADETLASRLQAINDKAQGRTFLGPQYSVDALLMTHAMLIRQPADDENP